MLTLVAVSIIWVVERDGQALMAHSMGMPSDYSGMSLLATASIFSSELRNRVIWGLVMMDEYSRGL